MKSNWKNVDLIWTLITAMFVSGILFLPTSVIAGQMILEYSGVLDENYTFYRGSFDLGDLDHDGAADMVIADDAGGFHVFHFTPDGFERMWLSDPLAEDGYIVSIKILNEDIPGYYPHIRLLDSNGTLHQFRYTGYIFEKTGTFPDYAPTGESGRIILTDVEGGERTVIIALPNQAGEQDESEDTESDDLPEEPNQWSGLTLYHLTPDGLNVLTDEEIAELEEGQVYFVEELTTLEIRQLQSLGFNIGRFFPGDGYGSGRAGIADLDSDALFELLISISDPDQPIDRLEIWSEEGGTFTVKITYELPLINEMVIADIDGDGFSEIVGLTYDGEVLVYQYDPLTVLLSDGTAIEWDIPHRRIDDNIWMCMSGFVGLGCTVVEDLDILEISLDERIVTLNKTDGYIRCGDEILLPVIPVELEELIKKIPFLPFLPVLECLGFFYTVPDRNLVEVEPSG